MEFTMMYDAYGDIDFLAHLRDSDFLTVTAVCLKAHGYASRFSSVAAVNHPCLWYRPLALIAKSVGRGVCYKKLRNGTSISFTLAPPDHPSAISYRVFCLFVLFSAPY